MKPYGPLEPVPTADTGYFRVPVAIVGGAECLPFALFLRIEGEYVEYFPAKVTISGEARQALDAAQVGLLWVREQDSSTFVEFIDRALENIIRDPAVSPYEKGSVLHKHTATATRHFLCSMPEKDARPERLDLISAGLCHFLEAHQFSFSRLVRTLGRDLDTFDHSARVALYGLILGRVITREDQLDLRDLGVSLLLHAVRELDQPPRNLERVLSGLRPAPHSVCRFAAEPRQAPTPIANASVAPDPHSSLSTIVCTFDWLTAAEAMPTIMAARSLLQQESRLDPALTRTFVGLLAR